MGLYFINIRYLFPISVYVFKISIHIVRSIEHLTFKLNTTYREYIFLIPNGFESGTVGHSIIIVSSGHKTRFYIIGIVFFFVNGGTFQKAEAKGDRFLPIVAPATNQFFC